MNKQPEQPPPYGIKEQPRSAPPMEHPQMVVVNSPAVGPHSRRMMCPSCRADISTRTETEPDCKTHVIACCLCLICLPCVFIPYCVDSCQNVNHYCPNCNAFIGVD